MRAGDRRFPGEPWVPLGTSLSLVLCVWELMVQSYSGKVLGIRERLLFWEGRRRHRHPPCAVFFLPVLLPWVKRCPLRTRALCASRCTWAPFSFPPCCQPPSCLPSLPPIFPGLLAAACFHSEQLLRIYVIPAHGMPHVGLPVCNLVLT